jgi:hypothetical protein
MKKNFTDISKQNYVYALESGRYGQQRIDCGDRLCEIGSARSIENFILLL